MLSGTVEVAELETQRGVGQPVLGLDAVGDDGLLVEGQSFAEATALFGYHPLEVAGTGGQLAVELRGQPILSGCQEGLRFQQPVGLNGQIGQQHERLRAGGLVAKPVESRLGAAQFA